MLHWVGRAAVARNVAKEREAGGATRFRESAANSVAKLPKFRIVSPSSMSLSPLFPCQLHTGFETVLFGFACNLGFGSTRVNVTARLNPIHRRGGSVQ